jgi:hypothetical protein
VAAKTIEQNVARRDGRDKPCIEPEKHPNVVCRPEIICDPSNKAAVEERFIEDVNDV